MTPRAKDAGAPLLLIVDGYNVLNQWCAFRKDQSISEARELLVRDLHDYAGFTGHKMVVVFDAWQSERLSRSVEETESFSVVFTKKGETADHYIERLCDRHAREVELGRLQIQVATSDGVEQTIVLGRGATRVPARELLSDMEAMRQTGRRAGVDRTPKKATILDGLPDDVRERLERMRRER